MSNKIERRRLYVHRMHLIEILLLFGIIFGAHVALVKGAPAEEVNWQELTGDNEAAAAMVNGGWAEKLLFFEAELTRAEAQFGADSPEILGALGSVASIQLVRGNYGEAEQLCRRGLAIAKAHNAKEIENFRLMLLNILQKQGRLSEMRDIVQ